MARRNATNRIPFAPLPTVSGARPLNKISAKANDLEFGGGSRILTARIRLAKATFYQLN